MPELTLLSSLLLIAGFSLAGILFDQFVARPRRRRKLLALGFREGSPPDASPPASSSGPAAGGPPTDASA